LNNDTNLVDQSSRDLSNSIAESHVINSSSSIHYPNSTVEEKIGHHTSSSSLGLNNSISSSNGIPHHSVQHPPLNGNLNQRTVGSNFSVLTENEMRSNPSSPSVNSVKINTSHEVSKSIFIDNTNKKININNHDQNSSSSIHSYSNRPHGERLNSIDSSVFFTPSPPKVQDTSSDYYNFFKYNDSYNSIFLSSLSKDKENLEKENNNSTNYEKSDQNSILGEIDKTESNELLTEMDKNNTSLSESSSPTPYYHRSASPLEKPPVVPNSPSSNKSPFFSSLNNALEENEVLVDRLPMKGCNDSNESFAIIEKDLNITGDTNIGEVPSLFRRNSKTSSISSLATPTIKSSLVISNNTSSNNLSRISKPNPNLGHYRTPSVSSTNTNGSSRFTVIRESNEKHSPNYSSANIRYSNVHNSSLFSSNDSISNLSSSVPSSKLKPSVVVIQNTEEDKTKSNGNSSMTTSIQSTNVGRFTVTRETVIS